MTYNSYRNVSSVFDPHYKDKGPANGTTYHPHIYKPGPSYEEKAALKYEEMKKDLIEQFGTKKRIVPG